MNKDKLSLQLNARTGGLYFTFTIALYVLISFVGQLVMSAVAEKSSVVYIAVCSTFSAIAFLIVIAYAYLGDKVNFKNLAGEGCGLKFIVPALFLSAGMFLALGYVNTYVATIFEGWGLKVNEIEVPLTSPWHLLVFSITLALLPAVAEELFFRGLILSSLSGVKKVCAVLISALWFALYHCSVAQLVYQFVYGVALGFLFLAAKSILPCIVAHFANNFTVLCLQYAGANIDLLSSKIIIIGAVCLAVFCAVIYLVLKKSKTEQNNHKTGEITKFVFPYSIFAIIVCIALAVSSLVG